MPADPDKFCNRRRQSNFAESFFERPPCVITGIGLITSIGRSREAVWQAVLRGESSIRRLTGIHGIPDGLLLGATVDIDRGAPGQLKNIPLCRQTAAEALADAGIDLETLDRDRVGCSIGAHMGDSSYVVERTGPERRSAPSLPWRTQSLPNTACDVVVNEFDLRVGQRNTGDTSRHLADWREILSNGCIKRMLSHAPRRS